MVTMVNAEDLFAAIKAGHFEQVKEIAQARPDLLSARTEGGLSPVLFAAYYGKAEIARWLGSQGPLSLYEASAVGDAGKVEKALAANPDLLNAFAPDGFTALGLAAFFGNPDVVDLLLQQGADPNIASQNSLHVMPLHSAVAARHLDIARELLAEGADPNARQQDGFTPLHEAAQNGQAEMVELLLAYAADPAATKDDGQTALDLARVSGHGDVVELLA